MEKKKCCRNCRYRDKSQDKYIKNWWGKEKVEMAIPSFCREPSVCKTVSDGQVVVFDLDWCCNNWEKEDV